MRTNAVWPTMAWLAAILFMSVALSADEPADAKAPSLRPKKAGVGIALKAMDVYPEVVHVLPESPAARSKKVHKGDRIIAVGDRADELVSTKGDSIEDAVAKIRGQAGTVVVLKIVPANKDEKDATIVTLTRGTIKELELFGDGQFIAAGTPAPELKGIVLADGSTFEARHTAGKITVVEFWAVWCLPCRKALDDLQKLSASHPEWKERVSFVAVAVDETQDDAAQFAAKKQDAWSALTPIWSGPSALKTFHVDGLPVVYVIDVKGKVLAVDHQLDLEKVIGGALKARKP